MGGSGIKPAASSGELVQQEPGEIFSGYRMKLDWFGGLEERTLPLLKDAHEEMSLATREYVRDVFVGLNPRPHRLEQRNPIQGPDFLEFVAHYDDAFPPLLGYLLRDV